MTSEHMKVRTLSVYKKGVMLTSKYFVSFLAKLMVIFCSSATSMMLSVAIIV